MWGFGLLGKYSSRSPLAYFVWHFLHLQYPSVPFKGPRKEVDRLLKGFHLSGQRQVKLWIYEMDLPKGRGPI